MNEESLNASADAILDAVVQALTRNERAVR
jgi:hypothetical protein